MEVEQTFEHYCELTDDGHTAAILTLAAAVNSVAVQIKYLGNGDAGTPMGAIEALGVVVKDGLSSIASAVGELAEAQRGV